MELKEQIELEYQKQVLEYYKKGKEYDSAYERYLHTLKLKEIENKTIKRITDIGLIFGVLISLLLTIVLNLKFVGEYVEQISYGGGEYTKYEPLPFSHFCLNVGIVLGMVVLSSNLFIIIIKTKMGVGLTPDPKRPNEPKPPLLIKGVIGGNGMTRTPSKY